MPLRQGGAPNTQEEEERQNTQPKEHKFKSMAYRNIVKGLLVRDLQACTVLGLTASGLWYKFVYADVRDKMKASLHGKK
eukprot:m.224859 g.224859  ORF g.224859 m.224859 type:complete len:79 (-) comp16564_c0_seq1:149-385(-)